MCFDGHRSSLDKCMLVMLILPMTFVAVPITFMIMVPIFVVSIAVPTILFSLDWLRR